MKLAVPCVQNSHLPLVSRTLDFAEATAKLAVAQGYPVALKFKEPIGYIDMLACKGLDALEHNVPLIKNAPEEVRVNSQYHFILFCLGAYCILNSKLFEALNPSVTLSVHLASKALASLGKIYIFLVRS